MKERLLHFIWQNKLFNVKELKTTKNKEIQILDFGKYNKDGGPDFWNARIQIDNIILAGNIELHVHASDWKLHKHHKDKKYNNVILHVVYFNNVPDFSIDTIELNGRIPPVLLSKYESMMLSKQELICSNLLNEVDILTIESWKERLVIERLERKSAEILKNLECNNNDWEQTCYQLLAKYFGSHINKEPFELLTHFLDYKILFKHSNNLFQLEALLFGVAGFLNKDFVEIYPRALKEEFKFLKHKYDLKSLQEHQWQFLRIRPVSFPTIRIAWFANVIRKIPLLSQILNANATGLLENVEVSAYWQNHYILDKLSTEKPKTLGDDFKSMLKINVLAPILYAYAKFSGEKKYMEKALDILYHTAKETNAKTKIYEAMGPQLQAYDTQAVIELYDNYCTHKRCLECRIGNKILRNNRSGILVNIL